LERKYERIIGEDPNPLNMYRSIKNIMATKENSVKLCFLQLQQIQVSGIPFYGTYLKVSVIIIIIIINNMKYSVGFVCVLF
jgi:hypothetical protein